MALTPSATVTMTDGYQRVIPTHDGIQGIHPLARRARAIGKHFLMAPAGQVNHLHPFTRRATDPVFEQAADRGRANGALLPAPAGMRGDRLDAMSVPAGWE